MPEVGVVQINMRYVPGAREKSAALRASFSSGGELLVLQAGADARKAAMAHNRRPRRLFN